MMNIIRETLFIVGAGAHKPYGFPTGLELREHILNRSYDYEPLANDSLRLMVPEREYRFDQSVLEKNTKRFIETFRGAQSDSIDRFIGEEANSSFVIYGKTYIACILKAIEVGTLPGAKRDWIQFLINKYLLPIGIKNLNGYFDFITFNYDLFLEKCLLSHFVNQYNLKLNEAIEFYKKGVNISHVYGSLGDIEDSEELKRSEVTDNDMGKIVNRIKIVGGERGETNLNIKESLKGKKRIFFLGFGFDEMNVSLLRDNINFSEYDVFATNYKMSEVEMYDVEKLLGVRPRNFDNHKDQYDSLGLISKFLHESYTESLSNLI